MSGRAVRSTCCGDRERPWLGWISPGQPGRSRSRHLGRGRRICVAVIRMSPRISASNAAVPNVLLSPPVSGSPVGGGLVVAVTAVVAGGVVGGVVGDVDVVGAVVVGAVVVVIGVVLVVVVEVAGGTVTVTVATAVAAPSVIM